MPFLISLRLWLQALKALGKQRLSCHDPAPSWDCTQKWLHICGVTYKPKPGFWVLWHQGQQVVVCSRRAIILLMHIHAQRSSLKDCLMSHIFTHSNYMQKGTETLAPTHRLKSIRWLTEHYGSEMAYGWRSNGRGREETRGEKEEGRVIGPSCFLPEFGWPQWSTSCPTEIRTHNLLTSTIHSTQGKISSTKSRERREWKEGNSR